MKDLNGRIAGILNAGLRLGIESTILDVTRTLYHPATRRNLRERLEEVLPGLIEAVRPQPEGGGRMRAAHYRPDAQVIPVKPGTIWLS